MGMEAQEGSEIKYSLHEKLKARELIGSLIFPNMQCKTSKKAEMIKAAEVCKSAPTAAPPLLHFEHIPKLRAEDHERQKLEIRAEERGVDTSKSKSTLLLTLIFSHSPLSQSPSESLKNNNDNAIMRHWNIACWPPPLPSGLKIPLPLSQLTRCP
ncbi:hypothetical protein E2C01_048579 [Portunus trituberculatus]|uniref:Uncharacterized protein n=1 Tax=Portunus trituberculatus TaxID=210409 RepID=A0A5B7GAX8_PORTR|nr:hypothetical protein [Portunus trituberculatus]